MWGHCWKCGHQFRCRKRKRLTGRRTSRECPRCWSTRIMYQTDQAHLEGLTERFKEAQDLYFEFEHLPSETYAGLWMPPNVAIINLAEVVSEYPHDPYGPKGDDLFIEQFITLFIHESLHHAIRWMNSWLEKGDLLGPWKYRPFWNYVNDEDVVISLTSFSWEHSPLGRRQTEMRDLCKYHKVSLKEVEDAMTLFDRNPKFKGMTDEQRASWLYTMGWDNAERVIAGLKEMDFLPSEDTDSIGAF